MTMLLVVVGIVICLKAQEAEKILLNGLIELFLSGAKTGHIRNAEMADNADALIAYWDGESRGTKNMIETAKTKGLKVYVHKYRQESIWDDLF